MEAVAERLMPGSSVRHRAARSTAPLRSSTLRTAGPPAPNAAAMASPTTTAAFDRRRGSSQAGTGPCAVGMPGMMAPTQCTDEKCKPRHSGCAFISTHPSPHCTPVAQACPGSTVAELRRNRCPTGPGISLAVLGELTKPGNPWTYPTDAGHPFRIVRWETAGRCRRQLSLSRLSARSTPLRGHRVHRRVQTIGMGGGCLYFPCEPTAPKTEGKTAHPHDPFPSSLPYKTWTSPSLQTARSPP